MTASDTDAVVVAAARAARQAGEDRPIRPFTFNAPQTEQAFDGDNIFVFDTFNYRSAADIDLDASDFDLCEVNGGLNAASPGASVCG